LQPPQPVGGPNGEQQAKQAQQPQQQAQPPQVSKKSNGKTNALSEQDVVKPPSSPITHDIAAASLALFVSQGGPSALAIFNELYSDADLKGNTLDKFMQNAGCDAQIKGHVGVLVDAPSTDDSPVNEAQRKRSKIRPYLVKVDASDIVDWELDDYGKFEWVRIKEDTVEPRGPFKASTDNVTIYYTWTKDSWYKHKVTAQTGKKTVELVDEGTNPLGDVPLVIVYNKRKPKTTLIGESAIDDISQICISILNWLSMLDEEVYQKCLSILTIKGTGDDTKDVELGSNNVLDYPEERPAFIAPDTNPWEFIIALIDRAIEEIYRIARLGGGGQGLKISEAKSGIAFAYEFNETNQALADKADSLEQAEREIHDYYARWYQFDFKGTVSYSDEFGVEDLSQELEFLTNSRSSITSITAKRELEKRVVKKLLVGQVDDTIMQRIMAEIDTNQPGDYKVPGEFIVPGESKPMAEPGADALNALLFGNQENAAVQALAEQILSQRKSKSPKGIPTVDLPNRQAGG
jgi:hypothetical protein